jgi:hypothetical protein
MVPWERLDIQKCSFMWRIFNAQENRGVKLKGRIVFCQAFMGNRENIVCILQDRIDKISQVCICEVSCFEKM